MLGVIARVGGPRALLDLDPDIFLALIEGVMREDPAVAAYLDELYAEAIAAALPPPPQSRSERNRDIARVMRVFNG